MDSSIWKLSCAAIAILLAASSGQAEEVENGTAPATVELEKPKTSAPGSNRAPEPHGPVWLDSLTRGIADARKTDRPIFLRAGGENCRYCRALEAELVKPELQAELRQWTLVSIDVDEAPGDARRLAVDGIPALRILTPTGKLVASHDGYLPADELAAWLKGQLEAASVVPAKELTEEGPPDAVALATLIREFKNRDPAIREAAVRRLIPYSEQAALAVVSAFSEGNLATRLAALELLQEWRAPIEGLDPWRPDTLIAARLRTLADWGASADRAQGASARENLSEDDLRTSDELLTRMLTAQPDEARAIRERLARFGRLLLPAVYARLHKATTDAERERLTSLRYRLVAPESLALGWSGGLERLAAGDPETRARAADELLRRATPAEESLLLELFSDPSPLVRELSLRALDTIGGANSHGALIRLLEDPEPNVRAAVLKQLAESASRTIVPRIAEYAAAETDPDLVVHAIRVLREAKGQAAAEALMKLLSHASWQVRAEAAEGLGKFIDRYSTDNNSLKLQIYTSMIDLLNDSDGFVLSRAVTVLHDADLIAAVDPLAKAAEAHPELAREVIDSLTQGTNQRAKAIVHVRRFSNHANPRLRAAAIRALCTISDDDIESRLKTALQDPESEVRLAAAGGFFWMMKYYHDSGSAAAMIDGDVDIDVGFSLDPKPSPVEGFLGGLFRALGGGMRVASPEEKHAPDPPTEDAPVAAEQAPAPTAVREAPAPVEAAPPPTASTVPAPVAIETVITEGPDGARVIRRGVAVSVGEPDGEADDDSSPAAGGRLADVVESKLQEIRAGKTFKKEWFALADQLIPMLSSPAAEERLAAALPLAALGRDDQAIPELMRLAHDERRFLARIAPALPWLLSADREKLLTALIASPSSSDEVNAIADQLHEIKSPDSEEELWRLLGLDWIDATGAESVRSSLLQYYFPSTYYKLNDSPPRAKKRAIAAAKARIPSGSHWQQITALSLLLAFEPESVAEIVRPLLADPGRDLAARVDLFQVLLASIPEEQGTKEAVEHLSTSGPSQLSDVALTYLTRGPGSIAAIREGRFHIESSHKVFDDLDDASGEPIVPGAPSGLKVDPLLPLLQSPDPRVAAQAGYLLALLENAEGLDPLINYWRARAHSDITWTKLVYRAISKLDDGSRLSVLKEIYAKLGTDQNRSHLKAFYWTVRGMSHPDVLPFRKQIRQDVGMDQLR